MGLYWMPYATRQLVKAALESVTCEGETMLVTLPSERSSAVQFFFFSSLPSS
jgi:hypothetical protein